MMQIIINIFISGLLYLLTAVSFLFIYGSAKFFNLAHGAIISLGGYLTWFFISQYEFSLSASLLLAVLLTACIGMMCEIIVFNPIRKRSSSSFVSMIASIGVYTVIQNMISLFAGDDTKIIFQRKITIGYAVGGAYITGIQIAILLVSLTLFIIVQIFFKTSRLGKMIRAVGDNPELCSLYGINTNKIILITFGIGSAIAAVAGILSALDTNMTPTLGFNLLLYGLVVMIIGGIGSTKGIMGAALLLALAQHLVAYFIGSKWLDPITYIILILFLVWRPLGFSGKKMKKTAV